MPYVVFFSLWDTKEVCTNQFSINNCQFNIQLLFNLPALTSQLINITHLCLVNNCPESVQIIQFEMIQTRWLVPESGQKTIV